MTIMSRYCFNRMGTRYPTMRTIIREKKFRKLKIRK